MKWHRTFGAGCCSEWGRYLSERSGQRQQAPRRQRASRTRRADVISGLAGGPGVPEKSEVVLELVVVGTIAVDHETKRAGDAGQALLS